MWYLCDKNFIVEVNLQKNESLNRIYRSNILFWWIINVGIEKSYVYRLGLSRVDIVNSFLLTKTIAMLNNRRLFSLEYVCVNFGLSLTSVLELGVC